MNIMSDKANIKIPRSLADEIDLILPNTTFENRSAYVKHIIRVDIENRKTVEVSS